MSKPTPKKKPVPKPVAKALTKPGTKPKVTKKQREANAKKRRAEVAKLIILGWTYSEMAEKFGCVKSTICADIKIIFKAWTEQLSPAEKGTWLLKELRKLDLMERGLSKKSESGGLGAVDRRLSIMARRAKMLGLDAPTKLDISATEIDDAIEKELELRAQRKDYVRTGKLERLASGGEAGDAEEPKGG